MAKDYYQVLGVAKTASVEDIKKAFRKQALKMHPDQGGDEQAFLELKQAFEYLITNQPKDSEINLSASYDPFTDTAYYQHTFFAPEHDRMAEFERSIRAEGCPTCHGMGKISKLVDASKGFLGREERFCKCQIVKV